MNYVTMLSGMVSPCEEAQRKGTNPITGGHQSEHWVGHAVNSTRSCKSTSTDTRCENAWQSFGWVTWPGKHGSHTHYPLLSISTLTSNKGVLLQKGRLFEIAHYYSQHRIGPRAAFSTASLNSIMAPVSASVDRTIIFSPSRSSSVVDKTAISVRFHRAGRILHPDWNGRNWQCAYRSQTVGCG